VLILHIPDFENFLAASFSVSSFSVSVHP